MDVFFSIKYNWTFQIIFAQKNDSSIHIRDSSILNKKITLYVIRNASVNYTLHYISYSYQTH
jgi:hypothetical protein